MPVGNFFLRILISEAILLPPIQSNKILLQSYWCSVWLQNNCNDQQSMSMVIDVSICCFHFIFSALQFSFTSEFVIGTMAADDCFYRLLRAHFNTCGEERWPFNPIRVLLCSDIGCVSDWFGSFQKVSVLCISESKDTIAKKFCKRRLRINEQQQYILVCFSKPMRKLHKLLSTNFTAFFNIVVP